MVKVDINFSISQYLNLMLCIDFPHARPFESKLSWLSLNRKVLNISISHFLIFSFSQFLKMLKLTLP